MLKLKSQSALSLIRVEETIQGHTRDIERLLIRMTDLRSVNSALGAKYFKLLTRLQQHSAQLENLILFKERLTSYMNLL